MKTRFSLACSLAAPVLIAALALAFRLWRLDLRPMHNDEANQAVRCGILLETGEYRYDAIDHHGPALYYFTLPILRLTSGSAFADTTEISFRILPALFGFALVLLTFPLIGVLGRPAALWAAAFAAAGPAMVFFTRFYIQETMLVFFTFGAIVCGWRYVAGGKPAWAVAAGLCLGMMHALKETCVIAYAAMAGAALATAAWNRISNRIAGPGAGKADDSWPRPRPAHLALAVLAAAAVSVTLFSSLFTYWRGVPDSVLTYFHYIGKAFAPGPHIHPFSFYLGMLTAARYAGGPLWTEGLIVGLAVAGAAAGLFGPAGKQRSFARFLAIYTILMTLIYSAIPYKTPWTMLSFYHGMTLLAGLGAARIVRACPNRALKTAAWLALAVGFLHLARQSYLANFRYESDPRNPYVYAHTSRGFLKLARRFENLAAAHPLGRNMPVAVVTNPHDAWPLPWYLRGYGAVGYWQDFKDVPADMRPAAIVASMDKTADMDAELRGAGFCNEFYGLRPGTLLSVYIHPDLWSAFLEARSRQVPAEEVSR